MTGPARGKDDATLAQQVALAPARAATRHHATVRWTDARGAHAVRVERRVVIGGAEGVDVLVADPAVSRLHAEITAQDDGLWVRDLDSRNGTFLEGIRVGSARVPDRATLQLGATSLVLAYEPTPSVIEVWPEERFGDLLGRSTAMRELFGRIARVAATDSTVLIQGETGTGKELVARAVHERSARVNRPFIVVDCGALPETLLEAELFGHAKGAFTGAAAARAGAFESADGGTVFLDEIGELPLAMQPRLLRVLESRTVRRLGESQQRAVNVRFVTATHRDLATMVNQGAFREDLYFRLAVVPLQIPPLRARREDIPALVQHFAPEHARAAFTPELMRELMGRAWLGNIRELRNFVERAVALGPEEALRLGSAPRSTAPRAGDAGAAGHDAASAPGFPPVSLDVPFKDVRDAWVQHLERAYLQGMLARHQGNVTAVARAAGLDPSYVHRLKTKHGL